MREVRAKVGGCCPPYTQEPALEKPWLAWGRLGGLLHP